MITAHGYWNLIPLLPFINLTPKWLCLLQKIAGFSCARGVQRQAHRGYCKLCKFNIIRSRIMIKIPVAIFISWDFGIRIRSFMVCVQNCTCMAGQFGRNSVTLARFPTTIPFRGTLLMAYFLCCDVVFGSKTTRFSPPIPWHMAITLAQHSPTYEG
jgi:hypothetical protein